MIKTSQYTKGKGYGKPKGGKGKGYGKPMGYGKPFNFSSKGKGKYSGKPFGGKGKGVNALEDNEWDTELWNNEQWINEYQHEYPQPPTLSLCVVEKKGPAIEQTPNLDSEIEITIHRTSVNNMYFDRAFLM